MPATVIDGKRIAGDVKEKVKAEVEELKRQDVRPSLATVLVGDNPASKTYLRHKHKSCGEVGIESRNYELPKDAGPQRLKQILDELNSDENVHGILVQLPLPGDLDAYTVIEGISPEKDVDGLHPQNAGKLTYKKHELVPCTPKGVITMLAYHRIPLAGRQAVVINRSNLVGKPLANLLLNKDCTVTICHSRTQNLKPLTCGADLLITGVGRRPDFMVTSDMIKDGAVVIDVAVTSFGGRLVGDVDFDSVYQRASYITPVPGGVGPMTVAMLLHNTLIATGKQEEIRIEYDLHEIWGS